MLLNIMQELERLHGGATYGQNFKEKQVNFQPTNNNKLLDSRRAHFGQKQHTNTQS